MSNEAPVNSYASREKLEPVASGTKIEDEGEVAEEKEGLGKRIFKQFFAMSLKAVNKNLWKDVVVPSIKNVLSDMIVAAKDLLIFGSSATSPSSDGKTDYKGMSEGKPAVKVERSGGYSFKNVVVKSRKEAIDILMAMKDQLARYEEVTVGCFYDLCGVESNFNDFSYGWKHLNGSDVRQTPSGWIIVLPPITKLSE